MAFQTFLHCRIQLALLAVTAYVLTLKLLQDFEELDDHYLMMVDIKTLFEEDFVPWINLVHRNDAAFSELTPSKKEEFIRSGLEKMSKVHGKKSREILAVTTFSQFGIECM